MTVAERLVAPDSAHPATFMVLIAPFGAMAGYLSVAVGYKLSQAGLPVEQVAALVGLSFLPHVWKFLWAPIADTTLTRKRWYLISSAISAAGIFAIGALPATPQAITALSVTVFVANVAVTFLGMAVEGLMATDTPPEAKGRAGGWFQAGNLGGGGIGGGVGLWLGQVLPAPWMAGAVVALAGLACCGALAFIREPTRPPRGRHLGHDLDAVLRDLWSLVRSRVGLLAMLVCFLPMGSGGASGLWAAIAGDWHASANTVALVTGVAGGFVSAAGCLLGGWLCDRMDRKAAYALFGGLLAACAVAMALAPRTETMYIVFTTLYGLVQGSIYAGFSALVLEAIGRDAAATRYNALASLSNIPITYMVVVDGWFYGRWGAGWMLAAEAAIAAVAIGVYVAAARFGGRSNSRLDAGPGGVNVKMRGKAESR